MVGTSVQAGQSSVRDAWLRKVNNATGVLEWDVAIAGAGDDIAEAVTFSPGFSPSRSDGVVVVGSFSAPLTLGNGVRARTLTVPVNRLCGWYCYGTFIARFDTQGRLEWAVSATGDSDDNVRPPPGPRSRRPLR